MNLLDFEIDDCWNRIGVWRTTIERCPELEKVIHCRNCPVFAKAGRKLLRTKPPEGYRSEWTGIIAKGKDDKAGGMGDSIMGHLPRASGALAILSATVLFAAALDIGHLDLAHTMSTLAVIPLAIFMSGMLVVVFMGGGNAALASESKQDDLIAKFDDFRAKTASNIATFQGRLDAMSGQDRDSLLAENKALKAELEAIHEAERAKVEDEFQQLRERNLQLEQQIKEWAVKTVGSAISKEPGVGRVA